MTYSITLSHHAMSYFIAISIIMPHTDHGAIQYIITHHNTTNHITSQHNTQDNTQDNTTQLISTYDAQLITAQMASIYTTAD